MKSEKQAFFDELAMANEQILWTGRPLARPYKIRNIEWTLIEFVKLSAIAFGFSQRTILFFKKNFFQKQMFTTLHCS
ncbi:hypothetical protein [Chryseosolibacter indicus]|uniref:Uncharacterized protein n=1 Tax=Chryseosolibacter indicus TaxID=2782351 RepID=A0ABS5VYP8_9BACT|nr:hypothetical protein [Chryseosolibacter indicus]MBT1706542.1 hypothetical protein [Chryseosolibacter indicus]